MAESEAEPQGFKGCSGKARGFELRVLRGLGKARGFKCFALSFSICPL